MDVSGKVAFVTGASSGIGRGIAEALARHGADVAVNYHRDQAGAEETAGLVRAAGHRALVVGGDVGDPEDVARMFTAVDGAFGRFDILINNAGIGGSGPVSQTTFERLGAGDSHQPARPVPLRPAGRAAADRAGAGRAHRQYQFRS